MQAGKLTYLDLVTIYCGSSMPHDPAAPLQNSSSDFSQMNSGTVTGFCPTRRIGFLLPNSHF